MAVTMTVTFPGTTEQYDQVQEKTGVGDDPPDGLIIHTCADVGGGNLTIVDVWESQDAYRKFSDERLGPAIGEVIGPPPEGGQPPQEQFQELYNVLKP